MRKAELYRYFLCFLPDEAVQTEIALPHAWAGQGDKRVTVARSHLSLCVFGAPAERDPSLAPRVDAALAGLQLRSCVVRLGRVRGGPDGATLYTISRKRELTALRRVLLARLAEHGLVPELEKPNPHITLGDDPFDGPGFDISLEWIPREIVLIESEHGLTRHNPLGRWPLLQPEQGILPFGEQLGSLRRARRSARPPGCPPGAA